MATSAPVPGTYQHYKGEFFEVLGIAEEPESGKQFVVYRSQGLMEKLTDDSEDIAPAERVIPTPTKGELAVCSVERFTELVDGKEFHGGRRVPRFRPVAVPAASKHR
jgi:hypothetical protein